MTASVWPNTNSRPCDRAAAFCAQYGLQLPILLAPMAGACPASLSIAVANAGGMGGCTFRDLIDWRFGVLVQGVEAAFIGSPQDESAS
jgi:IMP dehydrogenase/GMP reductase